MSGSSNRSLTFSFRASRASLVGAGFLLLSTIGACGDSRTEFRGFQCPAGTELVSDENSEGTWMYCWLPGRIPHGPSPSWYPDGTPRSRGNYFDGRWHGASVHYHRNGQKSQEGRYWEGHKLGVWKYWNEEGELTGIDVYDEEIPGLLLEEQLPDERARRGQ